MLTEGFITEDDYPKEALRSEQQGVSVATFTVSKKGLPRQCVISSSSGVAVLDRTTCEIIVSRFRFRPALDCKGRPSDITMRQRINWLIPASYIPGVPATVAIVDVDTSGVASNCRLQAAMSANGSVAGGRQVCDAIVRRRFPVRRGRMGEAQPYTETVQFEEPE